MINETLTDWISSGLTRICREEGSDNRLIIQGDRGYIVARADSEENDLHLFCAAGRALDRELSTEESQRLYDSGFRRENGARCYQRKITHHGERELEEISEELSLLMREIYATSIELIALEERFADRDDFSNPKLIDAMRRLSAARDMSSRQKLYWALVRADLVLALHSPPPSSLRSEIGRAQWIEAGLRSPADISGSVNLRTFQQITGYRSVGVFSSSDYFDQIDPRGTLGIRLPGRLAILLALDQGWDSLLINPWGAVGGELYRNELEAIRDGLARMGW